jgi:hypothetical protein
MFHYISNGNSKFSSCNADFEAEKKSIVEKKSVNKSEHLHYQNKKPL